MIGWRLEDAVLKKIDRFAHVKSWGPPSPLPSCKQNEKERERREGKKEEEEDRKAPLMRKNLAILKGNKGVSL